MIEMQNFVIYVHNYSENLEYMKIVFLIDLEHIAWTAKTVNNIFIWISTDMTLHDSTAIIDSFYISSLLSSSACVSQSSVILIIWQTCIVNSLFSNAGAASTYHYNVPWGWAQWRPTHGKQSSAKSTNYHWWFRLVPCFPIVRRVALRNVITHKPVFKLASLNWKTWNRGTSGWLANHGNQPAIR